VVAMVLSTAAIAVGVVYCIIVLASA
jgi:hypothetical protein